MTRVHQWWSREILCATISKMRRPRGNIIMTALFVAVFLFFLSVALVWTNRQDIALSLSMEHKMKAEAAARSGANYVYGALRATGLPPAAMEKTLASGAEWKVQIIRLQPERRRGRVLLLRSRGRSGPINSYVTFHLLESQLSSETAEAKDRLLVFHKIGTSPGTETDENPQPPPGRNPSTPSPVQLPPRPVKDDNPDPADQESTDATVLPPDFVVKSVKLGLPSSGSLVAQDGPIFASEKPISRSATSALTVTDTIPVFSSTGGAPQAFGPALINLQTPSDQTELRVLRKKGDLYEWDAIPAPLKLGGDNASTSTSALGEIEFTAPSGEWKGITIRGIDGNGTIASWTDGSALTGTVIRTFPAGGDKDWSGSSRATRAVTLRGAIASQNETVYSHAWQYLYLRYSGGGETPPLPAKAGSQILRSPCIVKYDSKGQKWDFAWNPLKDNGELTSPITPSPDRLWADSDSLYAVNSSNTNELLKLSPNGTVTTHGVINEGRAVVYQKKVYTPSNDPTRPGLIPINGGQMIDFKSLPDRVPAITGPVFPAKPVKVVTDFNISDLEVSEFSSSPEIRTVRRQMAISYGISPASSLVATGNDLYLNLEPKVEVLDPDTPLYGNFEMGLGTTAALARFDGARWHILPNGLMAALQGDSRGRPTILEKDSRAFQVTGHTGLNSPGDSFLCANYEGLPDPAHRYTVVSISTNPFEFE